MRKILFGIIIFLLIIGTYFFLLKGIAIGNFQVLGVKDIQQLGTTLDEKVTNAEEVVNLQFVEAEKKLSSSLLELKNKRTDYETKMALSSTEEIAQSITKEKHEIQFLWAKIGNYATKNGLKLTLDFKNSSGGDQYKDLEFTLEGSYTGISRFLYSVEDDEQLKFRIENFKLLPITVTQNDGDEAITTSTLQAKFSVKEINVNLGK